MQTSHWFHCNWDQLSHCEAHHTHKQIFQHFYFSEGKIKISSSVNFICVAGGIVSTWRIGRRDFETSPVGVGKP